MRKKKNKGHSEENWSVGSAYLKSLRTFATDELPYTRFGLRYV